MMRYVLCILALLLSCACVHVLAEEVPAADLSDQVPDTESETKILLQGAPQCTNGTVLSDNPKCGKVTTAHPKTPGVGKGDPECSEGPDSTRNCTPLGEKAGGGGVAGAFECSRAGSTSSDEKPCPPEDAPQLPPPPPLPPGPGAPSPGKEGSGVTCPDSSQSSDSNTCGGDGGSPGLQTDATHCSNGDTASTGGTCRPSTGDVAPDTRDQGAQGSGDNVDEQVSAGAGGERSTGPSSDTAAPSGPAAGPSTTSSSPGDGNISESTSVGHTESATTPTSPSPTNSSTESTAGSAA
ncbi:uncharacterized protein TM35_000641140, partial [Trypanosoma theileri]